MLCELDIDRYIGSYYFTKKIQKISCAIIISDLIEVIIGFHAKVSLRRNHLVKNKGEVKKIKEYRKEM